MTGVRLARKAGAVLLTCAVGAAVLAPVLAPHAPGAQLEGLLNAPPTAVHLQDDGGVWHAPFIYPAVLVSRLEQTYRADRARLVPLVWGAHGRLVGSADEPHAPFLLLGADGFGRDVFSRVLYGARTSLALAAVAALGATLIGGVVGAVAGYAGGWVDEILMRLTDVALVLPLTYVALALRSALPLVLPAPAVFALLATIFAVVGAPFIARGVRGIVRGERRLDYVTAAIALGASPLRVLWRHVLPATRGFVLVQVTLLVPAFIVAEATLSYAGLGLPEPVVSWGTMLHEASSVRAFTDFPWLLTPAVAMFLVVFGVNLLVADREPPIVPGG